MIYAVVQDNAVTNLIVANDTEKPLIERELKADLVDASMYNLMIGDLYRQGRGWTRNVGGEQVVLTDQLTYVEMMDALESIGCEVRKGKPAFFDSLQKVKDWLGM